MHLSDQSIPVFLTCFSRAGIVQIKVRLFIKLRADLIRSTQTSPSLGHTCDSVLMSPHSLFHAFSSGAPAFGAWLTLPGTFHARSVASASPHLSWIVVDCEHGLIPLVPAVAEIVSAIEGIKRKAQDIPLSTIVRIPATGVTASTSWQIKHALDAGARGVLVPLV